MSTNISKKLQNTQMEKTQKSRFSGCLLFTLCYLIANYSYIHLAPRSKEMQRSECPLAPLQWDVKLNLDDTEQDTYRTRKANPNFKSKQGKSKGSQEARLQRRHKGPGPPNELLSVTEKWRLSALHLGTGEKPRTNRETLPDRFQVQTSKYFTLSLWKWVLERK